MNDSNVEVGSIFGQCIPPIKVRPESILAPPQERPERSPMRGDWHEFQLDPPVAFSLLNNDGEPVDGFFKLSRHIMPGRQQVALVGLVAEREMLLPSPWFVSFFQDKEFTNAASDEDRARLVFDGCLPSAFDEAHVKRFLRECLGIRSKSFEPETNSAAEPSLARDLESMRAFERQLEELTDIPAREIRKLGLWQLGGSPVNNENDNRVYIVGRLPRESDSEAWALRYEPTTSCWEAVSMPWHLRAGLENYTNEYRLKVLPGLSEWSPADVERLDEIVAYVSAV